ncbi:MAG: hypothetical protein PHP31_06895 [Lentimicrobiaceae bacterium]|nr:hypothetical protein [Lentimicrobiaceae bacterium]
MKKIILIAIIIVAVGTSVFAQSNYNKFVKFGVMVPLRSPRYYSLYPLDLSFEYVFFSKGKFSIGAEAGGYYGVSNINNEKNNFGSFHLKPLVHFNFTEKFDVFTGIGFYAPINSNGDTKLHWQATLGARYFIIKNFGVYTRGHVDYDLLEFGVSYRF